MHLDFKSLYEAPEGGQLSQEEIQTIIQDEPEFTEVPEDQRVALVQLDLALEEMSCITDQLFGATTPLTTTERNAIVLRYNFMSHTVPITKLSQEDLDVVNLSMEDNFKQNFLTTLDQLINTLGKMLVLGVEFVKDLMDSTESALRKTQKLKSQLSNYNPESKTWKLNKRRLQGTFDDGYGKWLDPEVVMPQLELATKHVFGEYWNSLEQWISSAKAEKEPDSMGLNTYFQPLPRQIQFQLVGNHYHYLNIGKPQITPNGLVLDMPTRSKLQSMVSSTESTLRYLKSKQNGLVKVLQLLDSETKVVRRALGGTLRVLLDTDTRLEYQRNVASLRVKSRLAINVVKTFAAYSLALCEYSNQYAALVLSQK